MPIDDPQEIIDTIEAYLDGRMSPLERESLENRLDQSPELAEELTRQERLQESLRRLHAPAIPSLDDVESMLQEDLSPASSFQDPLLTRDGRRLIQGLRIVAVAVAASLVCAIVAWQWRHVDARVPFFETRPLVNLYDEAVTNGFRPYYDCHEPERFADTFIRRQGRPLRLTAMAEGSRMLGLSYPGGLSRDTTAILCEVDDEPVMVFVDRESADQIQPKMDRELELRVFREQRDGLVFYEVTPLDAPRVLACLVAVQP